MKWEYVFKAEKFDFHDFNDTPEKFLNIMGSNGWELVWMRKGPEVVNMYYVFQFVFKRPKP